MLPHRQLPVIESLNAEVSCCLGSPVSSGMLGGKGVEFEGVFVVVSKGDGIWHMVYMSFVCHPRDLRLFRLYRDLDAILANPAGISNACGRATGSRFGYADLSHLEQLATE